MWFNNWNKVSVMFFAVVWVSSLESIKFRAAGRSHHNRRRGNPEEQNLKIRLTEESSSSSEEPLPAEKGELGIPEQFMKVRHGVYNGAVAVFVDSEEVEEESEEEPIPVDDSTNFKQNPIVTTTSAPQRKTPTTMKLAVHSSQIITRKRTTARPTTTTASGTTEISNKQEHSKIFIHTMAKTPRITSTNRPVEIVVHALPSSTLKPLHHKLMPLQTMKTVAPIQSLKSQSKLKKISSSCLHTGERCRRHNECCNNNCNWRMGMKCDY